MNKSDKNDWFCLLVCLKKLPAAIQMEDGRGTSGRSSGGIKRERYTAAAEVQYRTARVIMRNYFKDSSPSALLV